MLCHVAADFGPDGEEGALAFVVAGAVGVGFAKVARDDGAVHSGHDLSQGQTLGCSSEQVTASDPAL